MSPTVFRHRAYRFFFFSREEMRPHIHVSCPEGEAKFWVDPAVSLEKSYGLPSRKLKELQRLIEEHRDEIRRAWKKHFGS